ncbi:MAG: hypothetical protein GWO02_16165, partial [Gammaproteobacteria bacterium]|nr:hypothetical protein [Gammaproteobacteria bacterium]
MEAWHARLTDDLLVARAHQLLERLGPVVTGARAAGDRNIIGHVLQMEAQLSDASGDRSSAASA